MGVYLHTSSSFEIPDGMATATKRQLSPEHLAALQGGLKASGNGGQAGVKLGRERALRALQWVYVWGWSAPSIIDNLAQSSRKGLTARLVRQGLLKQHRTPAGGGVRDVPIYMLTLTKLGESEVVRHIDDVNDLIPYAPRVAWPQMRHDFIVQKLTLLAMQSDQLMVRSIKTDMVVRAKGAKGKIHDAVWTDEYQIRTFVEVELTPKKNRELEMFVFGCYCHLRDDVDSRLRIYSDSNALLEHYKERFEPYASGNLWQLDKHRHWEANGEFEIPPEVAARVSFHHLDDELS